MIKSTFKYLIVIVAFIAILFLIFFGYIFIFESKELNHVAKEDWSDDWEKSIQNNLPTTIEDYNLRYSIINNFSNTDTVVFKTLNFIDSIKYNETISDFYLSFIWTTKYNHQSKVEYVNENYVDDIATLFNIEIVYRFSSNKREYLISNIELSKSLKNKNRTPIPIRIVHKTNKSIILETDYEEGFNFFTWQSLQEFTKNHLATTNKSLPFLLKDINNKVLASIIWESKMKGYRLQFLYNQ